MPRPRYPSSPFPLGPISAGSRLPPALDRVGIQCDGAYGNAHAGDFRHRQGFRHRGRKARADHPIEIDAGKPRQGLGRRQQAFRHHVDGDRQRRPVGALGATCLEQEQRAGLDGKFEILRIGEQKLQLVGRFRSAAPKRRAAPSQAVVVAQALASGDHVLALAVELKVEIQLACARSPDCG